MIVGVGQGDLHAAVNARARHVLLRDSGLRRADGQPIHLRAIFLRQKNGGAAVSASHIEHVLRNHAGQSGAVFQHGKLRLLGAFAAAPGVTVVVLAPSVSSSVTAAGYGAVVLETTATFLPDRALADSPAV